MSNNAKEETQGIWPWLSVRLFPRGTNMIFWAAYVILITLLILYVLDPPEGLSPFRYTSTLMALSFLLVINIVWDDLAGLFSSEFVGKWVLLFITAGLAFYTVSVGQMYMAIYVIFMIAAQANSMMPGKPAILFSIAMSVIYMIILYVSGAAQAELQGTMMGLIIGMTFTITLSQVLKRYTEQTDRAKQLLAQLQRVNAELIAARQKEKELAIAEERVRMARDLHDGLGHHLTALSIQLQAAEKLVKINPDVAAEAIGNARSEVQAALKEVRQSVAVLREAPVDIYDLPGTIAALVDETGRRTGLVARFTQTGEASNLPPAAAMTLYRAAQEGLTNVQKHAASASQVQVTLMYAPDEVSLAVNDDGALAASKNKENGEGFGLAGLRERANLLGGSLQYGAGTEGGFRVVIILPVGKADSGALL